MENVIFVIAKSREIIILIPWNFFMSNEGGYLFSDYVIVNFENVFHLKNEWKKRHFHHRQNMGYRDSDSLDLFTSNVGGYIGFRCCELRF